MVTVGIKELKAKLSSYVDKAIRGEDVVITEHGAEVAVMSAVSRERRAMKSLVAAGKAQWTGGKPKGLDGVHVKGRPMSDTVLDERQ
jgi:prevent-host-death family protein